MSEAVYYWPNAITEDGEKLYTYECVPTMEKAKNQFSIWEDHYKYKIKTAWIEATDGTLITMRRKWVPVHAEREDER